MIPSLRMAPLLRWKVIRHLPSIRIVNLKFAQPHPRRQKLPLPRMPSDARRTPSIESNGPPKR